MRINQNIAAFNSYRNLNQTQNQLSSSLEKLSSGFRINRAADDASGLVNSENLRAQIGGLNVAQRNSQDAISLVQTAEGAMTEVHSGLQRMRDLVVESGNLGTNDEEALQANQDEIDQLVAELNRISEQTQFGTKRILQGAPVAEVSDTLTTQTDSAGTFAEHVALAGFESTYFDGTVQDGAGTDVAFNLDTDTTGDTLTVAGAEGADTAEIEAEVQRILDTVSYGDGRSLGDVVSVDSITGSDTTTSGTNDSFAVAFTFDANSLPAEGEEVYVAGEGADADFTFQVGANARQTVDVSIGAVGAVDLGVSTIDVTTGQSDDIDAALESLDAAISDVSSTRGGLGALQNRLEGTIRNLSVASENLSAAESRIRDTDMASEMVEFTRHQILQQAGTAMLAQANQVPQSVLSLLQ